MTYSELLSNFQTELPKHIEKAVRAIEELSDEQFNAPVNGEWCVAKVVRHLILADAPYIQTIAAAIAAAPKSEDKEVRHTWFGGTIARMAGPGGNAPAPKPLIPENKTFGKEIVEEWRAQCNSILDLAKQAQGLDLNAARYRNPFIKMFKMNLCDAFAISLTHTDRHVRQIVERAKANK